MIARRHAVIAAGCLTFGTLAACSGTEQGSPNMPATGNTTAPSASAAAGAAPRVTEPLDSAALTSDPCGLLTPEQLSKLGLAEGESGSSAAGEGPTCTWKYSAAEFNQVGISSLPSNTNGLSDIYAQRDQNEYFEPTEISGYPAVYSSQSDRRADGRCVLHVGVTDQATAFVFTQLSEGPDVTRPCQVAERTAEAMIDTLRGGS